MRLSGQEDERPKPEPCFADEQFMSRDIRGETSTDPASNPTRSFIGLFTLSLGGKGGREGGREGGRGGRDSQAARGRTRDKSKELGHSGEPKAQTRSFQLQQEMVGTSMLILTQLPLGGHGPRSVLARSVLCSTLAK